MSKEKKQLVVMGVLVLAVLGIGAFQFMGGGSKPAPVVEEESKKAEPEKVAVAEEPVDPTRQVIDSLIEPSAEARDPFAPQAKLIETDKTKAYNPPVDMPETSRPVRELPSRIEEVAPVDPTSGQFKEAEADAPFGLLGVVIGRNTVAVFKGDNGEYVLANVGDKIAESTYVEGVTAESVSLRYRGKLRVLALRGGN